METADTARPRRPRARGLVAAALAALAGCASPEPTAPNWAAAPCHLDQDFERCDDREPGLRWRCTTPAEVWTPIGYCPQHGVCAPAPLPIGATAGEGTTCLPPPADAGASGDASADADGQASGDSGAKDLGGDGAIGGLCGNGVCDLEEAAGGCPSDCAPAVCGDGQCQASEKHTCAYDCSPGAAAAVACALAACPGQGQQCQAKPGCLTALAQVWACAHVCSGCLAKCLQRQTPDPLVFAVASCAAPSCFAGP